jgi:hypothetical protein
VTRGAPAQADLFAPAPAAVVMGKPTTIAEVLDLLLGNLETSKGFETMTPTRYGHGVELLQEGVSPALVGGAIDRIHASHWLKKRARAITEADLEVARLVAAKAGVTS